MSRLFRSTFFLALLALLTGLGLGLAYSWLISPVTYVDASPAILRADFKDQYRIIIAASYAANQDLPRAQARLSLLGDPNPMEALSAQAQRMLAAGEPFESARPLARLATDLQQGVVSEPFTPTAFPTFNTPVAQQAQSTATLAENSNQPEVNADATFTPQPTVFFEQTPLSPVLQETIAPRPTFTATAGLSRPFLLVGQETLCDPDARALMQFIIINSRREQIPGVEIVVTWNQGEDRFFTGFKPELGNGYADFVMQADTVYSIRIVTGGAFVTDIRAPICTDPNGVEFPGGLLLTFEQS